MNHVYDQTLYKIGRETVALFPEQLKNGDVGTRVLETNRDYLLNIKPLQMVKKSCEYYGSSLRGRQDATKALSGITYKPPIVLSTTIQIFLFPTSSPTSGRCGWISYQHAERMGRSAQGVFVRLNEDEQWFVDMSAASLETQLYRTAFLHQTIMSRVG
ncbi:competence protein ComK [Aureibacillus halotolerans]|uniref:Competence protein ComK n=1 Tax=Aureibacillus halotolerans TaxID=1508390 RepID=A0A4R6UFY5_9BACI|nr:competence protein ComK [Aureibacillus halotolerans]TDQ42054.1 competence protein ComK [Aureibacillus halotolerans]